MCALLATALAFGLLEYGVAQAGVAAIKVSNTLAGPLITDARGYVLFIFSKGGHGIARCERIKTCAADWPAVTTSGKPVAGDGLNPKLLKTIPYAGRLREVTYAGWPLHSYKFAFTACKAQSSTSGSSSSVGRGTRSRRRA